MIDILKSYNIKVNFSKGIFDSDEKIILIENDNRSVKFIFNFEENINGQTVLLKIKHYLGKVTEKIICVEDNKSEFIFTNDILTAGNLKMSISLIGTDNEILTSTEYLDNIVICESLGNGEEPSEEDVTLLSAAISEVNKVKLDIVTAKENGDFNGLTAYEEAVSFGFTGTKEEWLISLKGEKGDKGEPGTDFDEEELNQKLKKYEKKHGYYQMTINESIAEETEVEIPCNYIVGNDELIIYYNGDRLLCEKSEDDEANYREVGQAGDRSKKVIFGWNLRIGDVLDFIVKGVVENNEESEN